MQDGYPLSGPDQLAHPDLDRDVFAHIDVLAGEWALQQPVDDDPTTGPAADRPAARWPKVGVAGRGHAALAERQYWPPACVVHAQVDAAGCQTAHGLEGVDVFPHHVPDRPGHPVSALVGGLHHEPPG